MRALGSVAALATALCSAGCTLVSGGDDLQIYEGGNPKATCAACTASAECASGNCRRVGCSSGEQITLCLPENANESTQPAEIPCDWDLLCP